MHEGGIPNHHHHHHTHLTRGAPGQQQRLGRRRGAVQGPPVAPTARLAVELGGRWRGPRQGGGHPLLILLDELLDEVCGGNTRSTRRTCCYGYSSGSIYYILKIQQLLGKQNSFSGFLNFNSKYVVINPYCVVRRLLYVNVVTTVKECFNVNVSECSLCSKRFK